MQFLGQKTQGLFFIEGLIALGHIGIQIVGRIQGSNLILIQVEDDKNVRSRLKLGSDPPILPGNRLLAWHPEEYTPRAYTVMLIMAMVTPSFVQNRLPPLEMVAFFKSEIDARAASHPAQRQIT